MLKKLPLIAIVDDDESMRDALKGFVRSVGFAAETFSSPRDFLSSPHLYRTVCLIADVHMPEMTGIDLHNHLAASGIHIPTILITAYLDDKAKARALRKGVVCYLKKPFTEDELLACIRSALSETCHG